MSKRIHVAVGVIYNAGQSKVLITKRTAEQHLAGYWEFPGGKVEDKEDVLSALSRELYEELGLVVKRAKQLTTVKYDYPDKKVFLDIWTVDEWSGTPISKENQEITWSKISELSNFKFPQANKHIIGTLSLSPIYLISPLAYTNKIKFLSIIEECFQQGVNVFQLRLNSKNKTEFTSLINELNILINKYKAKLILNGTPSDIEKLNISGIHLNSEELLNYKKRPIDENYILGASCHNEKELLHAEKINVNYAFLSPVRKTNSHPGTDTIGWDKFKELRNRVKIPVYALGGMNPNDLAKAKKHDAHGIAMISAVWSSENTISNIFSK